MQQDQVIPVTNIGLADVVRTAGITGVSTLAGQGAGYLSLLLLTLWLGAGGFGLFSLAVAVETIAGIVARFGLDVTMLRFAAWYRGREDNRSLQMLLGFVILFVAAWGSIVALALWGMAPFLSGYVFHKPELMPILRIAAWGIPLGALFYVLASGLHGCGLTTQRVYLEQIILPLSRLALFTGTWITRPSAKSAIGAYVVAYGLVAGIAGLWLARENRFWEARLPNLGLLKAWAEYAVPAFLDSLLVTALGGSLELTLLGVFSTREVVGVYSVLSRLRFLVDTPMMAFNTSLAPLISRLHAKGARAQLSALFTSATRWVLMLGLPLGTIVVVFGETLLGLFGEAFTVGHVVLTYVTITQLASMCVGPVGHMLLMTGHSRVRLANSLVLLALQLGLGLLLIPRWQLVGAGSVAAVSTATLSILAALEVFVLLGMHPYQFELIKPLAACLLSAAGIAAVQSHVQPSLWLQGFLMAGFIMTYVGLLLRFGLNGEDRALAIQGAERFAERCSRLRGVGR